jgi:hypothetical protein
MTSADLETICLHGEGSPYAERMTILMEARGLIKKCKQIVEELAAIKK